MREQLAASDWDLVKRLLPNDWQLSARQCGALRRTRNVDSAETLLRLILLHVAGGLSLRQTVVRAEAFGWATLSDMALLKRLRAATNWLESLCWSMWAWEWPPDSAGGESWTQRLLRNRRPPVSVGGFITSSACPLWHAILFRSPALVAERRCAAFLCARAICSWLIEAIVTEPGSHGYFPKRVT